MRACSQLCGAQGALEFVATAALAPPPPSLSPPSSRTATTLGLSGPTLWSWSLQVPRSESPFRTMHQTRFDCALRFYGAPGTAAAG